MSNNLRDQRMMCNLFVQAAGPSKNHLLSRQLLLSFPVGTLGQI
jgi:hypothetical protein